MFSGGIEKQHRAVWVKNTFHEDLQSIDALAFFIWHDRTRMFTLPFDPMQLVNLSYLLSGIYDSKESTGFHMSYLVGNDLLFFNKMKNHNKT